MRAQCEECSSYFEYEPIIFQDQQIFHQKYCDACGEKLTKQAEESDRLQRESMARNRFYSMIPPIYRETQKSRLSGILSDVLQSFEKNDRGLGIIGGSGKGKTRIGILCLEKIHKAGHSTFFISATDFALNCANQFADNPAISSQAEEILRRCKVCDLLMLDDLGKNRMTDRVESELYDLLEHRTSQKLPMIWTSNSDQHGLGKMLSEDRSVAILRRLWTEFNQIVKV